MAGTRQASFHLDSFRERNGAFRMIAELFKALFAAGIPVAVCSFLLAWWALKNRYVGTVDSIRGLEQEVKRLSKSKSKKGRKSKKDAAESQLAEPPRMSAFHNKWLSFGGGFYGVVALMTYAVIELKEVRDFVADLGGLLAMLSNISLDLLIQFLINSFVNFISAVTWPIYWMSAISSSHIWIWFLLAYAGYWAGTRYAVYRAGLDMAE